MAILNEEILAFIRNLKDPEFYVFEGTYQYCGKENKYHGELAVDDEMHFIGECIDTDHMSANKAVVGRFLRKTGIMRMDFIKMPDSGLLAPVEYQLFKAGNDEITGAYRGFWSFTEKATITELLYNLDNPDPVGVVEKISDQSNTGSLTLYRK